MLGAAKKEKKETSAEILRLGEYMATLHGSCDFLVENFDLRQEARANEMQPRVLTEEGKLEKFRYFDDALDVSLEFGAEVAG